jgi:hypothetical protein
LNEQGELKLNFPRYSANLIKSSKLPFFVGSSTGSKKFSKNSSKAISNFRLSMMNCRQKLGDRQNH